MTATIKFPYRFGVALLLVALLCAACGARQTEQTSTRPLLDRLAGIPQDPINQADAFMYFVDYSALESAYNVTRPADAEAFGNAREGDESSKVWWVILRGISWGLQEPWLVLETMPKMVGFSALEVDHAIQFGTQPSQGLILAGSFDADKIRTAYQTNLGLAENDLDGETVWCWDEDCADGAQLDLKYRMRENPFGGNLGQRQPMIIGNDKLMAATDLELVQAQLSAAAGKLPNLAEDPAWLAAVKAVSKDAEVLQAMIANPTVTQRMADKLPIDYLLSEGGPATSQDTLLESFQEIPPFELLILADAVTADEQIARLGVVYKDANSAELAAPILLDRLASLRPISRSGAIAFSEMLAERHVTNPRYYVQQEAGRAVLVLEFATPKATPEEIIPMLDLNYQGAATPPGLIYRLFIDLFNSEDTSWLSTATRSEIEALQVGTLVGVNVSMDLSALLDGVIDQAQFGGIVTVELDDGTKVDAIWNRSLGDQIVGGMKLLIAPTDDPDLWQVLRIMEMP